MKVYPDTKIYIACPGNLNTGGPESLHQLASILVSFGVQTYIFYYGLVNTPFNTEDPVHNDYKKYHVPYTFQIEDKPHNIFIVPEAITEYFYLYKLKRIRRVLWWMSVNNYITHIINVFNGYLKDPLANPLVKFFCFGKENADIEHWGQSEYVRQFLRLNGVKNIQTVETHMSQNFLSRANKIDFDAKENFVAYNPRKGFEFTQQLINLAPDIDWRPIVNMTPAQVQALLAKAKVYIDFGEFPGRERLPREATLSGCVVITGKRGASANDVDINIPAEFKFAIDETKPYQVIKKILEVFDNFDSEFGKQTDFHEHEINAKKNFANEVSAAFEIKRFPPPSVALPQGFSNGTTLLIERLKRENLLPRFIADDIMSSAEMATLSDGLIIREQNRNYVRLDDNLIEIITRDDAKFLYLEGRIKKFALLEPSDAELAELKNFYEAENTDILIF